MDLAPASSQAVSFSVARTSGVSRSTLRSSRYVRLRRGLYLPASAGRLEPTMREVYDTLPDGSYVAGLSAARLLELPVPLGGCPEFVVPWPAGAPDRAGIQCGGVLLPEAHRSSCLGLPVVAAHRLFIDLAARISLVALVALGDAILQQGLASTDELRETVAWGRRRPGVVAARRALTLLDGRSRSTGETRVRLVLVLAGLPAPECNVVVRDSLGGWLAEPDLVYEEWRIVYEYDGAHHFVDPHQRRRDVGRNEMLRDEDWIVLVVTSVDERWPQRILDRTARALIRRGVEPPPGLSAAPYLAARQLPPPLRRG